MPRVLVTEPIDPAGVAILSQVAQVDQRHNLTPEELKACIGAYDGLLVRSATKVTQDVITAGHNLKIIGRAGVGVDNIDVPAATRQGIVVESVLTLGTGVGSALFTQGHLVPNLELGHHPFRKNATYEECLGHSALKRHGVRKWNQRLEKALAQWQKLFHYDHLYLGGGNAKHISFDLPPQVKTVPNVAGLLGGIALWRDEP